VDRREKYEWLREEVSNWKSEGLIDDHLAQAILSRYGLGEETPIETPAEVETEGPEEEGLIEKRAKTVRPHPELAAEEAIPEEVVSEAAIPRERETQSFLSTYNLGEIVPEDAVSRLIFIISFLGSILLGVGAILFVASNWDAIPEYVRFLLLFGVTLGTYFLGWRLKFQTGSHPRAGHALLFLASIFVGATIFLTAQIFNVNANVHWLILLWFLAISPMGYGFNSRPILGLSTFTFVLWTYVYLMTGWLLEAFMLYLVMGICFYGIGAIHAASERYSRFRTIYQAVGLFFILASYFYFSIETPYEFEIAGMDWPFKAFFLLLTVGSIGTVLTSIFQRNRFGTTWEESSVLFLAFLGWAVTLFLNLFWDNLTVTTAGRSELNPEVAMPLFVFFNLAISLLALGAILIGDRRSEDLFVGLGTLFIGLETLHLLYKEAFMLYLLIGVVLYGLGLYYIAFYRRSRFQVVYQIAGLFFILAYYLYLGVKTTYHFEIIEADWPFRLAFFLAPLTASIATIAISQKGRFRMMQGELSILLLAFLGWIVIGILALFWRDPAEVVTGLNPEANALLFAIFNLILFAISLIVVVIGYRRSIDAFIGLGLLFITAEILNLFKEEFMFVLLLIGIILYTFGLIPVVSEKFLRFQTNYQIFGLFLILVTHLYFSFKNTYYFEIFEADWPIKGIFFLIPLIATIAIVGASQKEKFKRAKYDPVFLLLAFLGWIVVGVLAFFWQDLTITDAGRTVLISEVNTFLFIFFNLLLLSLCVSGIVIGYFRSMVSFVDQGLLFFVIGVLHIYFTTVYAYLPRSLALIVGGLILLVSGWRLEKVRRTLIKNMNVKTTKEGAKGAEEVVMKIEDGKVPGDER